MYEQAGQLRVVAADSFSTLSVVYVPYGVQQPQPVENGNDPSILDSQQYMSFDLVVIRGSVVAESKLPHNWS